MNGITDRQLNSSILTLLCFVILLISILHTHHLDTYLHTWNIILTRQCLCYTGFLTGVQQNHARKLGISVDSLVFSFRVRQNLEDTEESLSDISHKISIKDTAFEVGQGQIPSLQGQDSHNLQCYVCRSKVRTTVASGCYNIFWKTRRTHHLWSCQVMIWYWLQY